MLWNIRAVVIPGTGERKNITFCDTTNPCPNEHRTLFMNTQSIWASNCPECTEECFHTDFILKSSSLSAPPVALFAEIKQFVESSNITLSSNWSTSWISEIPSNYVSLDVAYENVRTDLYTQQASLGPVDVLSNVGGQTGLWIGISFLSMMEIVEMIYRLIRCMLLNLRTVVNNRIETH